MGLKVSWAGFPTCHKATYAPNRALKHLAEQWTSPVGNSVGENFSLNQHINKISGRRDSSQISFYISLITNATLCFPTKYFFFRTWNSFVWKVSCVLGLKNKDWAGLWSREIFQVYMKSHFLRNLEKVFCVSSLGSWFLLPVLLSESQGRLLWHNLTACPAEGKVLVLESLAEVPHRKLKFIFPNPLCKSACLPGWSLLPLPVLFCCCFSGFRAVPPASILKDEQSDPFSLLSNSHWLLCH